MKTQPSWAMLIVLALFLSTPLAAQDEHWSRQFNKPSSNTKMLPGTGLSDGGNRPSIKQVKWHDGKLWMAGAWESGVDPQDLTKKRQNDYWYLWTWSASEGYQVVCQRHTAQGGQGPDGVIQDFLFLPDGRLVVAGSFTRVDNPGGNRYHNVNALAVYDPQEPSANRWQPLGSVQYNGTVSPGGSIMALAYDPQGNDLYIGGTFGGLRLPKGSPQSAKIHRYDFDSGLYEPVLPGIGGAKPQINKIWVDTSTQPSTIYLGGKFHYTAGNGLNPENSASTAKYSTGFAAWQEGSGWRTFPADHPTDGSQGAEAGILARAGDYAHFDAVHVLDFLVDGADIWIVGAFSQGSASGETLRGIARWDAERQVWADPTGRGGVGREVFSIAKAANGKLYFAGAFGGRTNQEFYAGFMNGDPAHMAISYDPGTDTWEQLGSGLSGNSMPECRLAVDGNDVYFVGDFEYIDPQHFEVTRTGKKEFESWYIARWNETIDFLAQPAEVAESNAPFELWGPGAAVPSTPEASGNEQWSRAFPPPDRGKPMTGSTGMSDGIGTPDISGIAWIGDVLYFGGSWEAQRGERWYVWSYHPEKGYTKLGWSKGSAKEGVNSPPEGIQAHDGKLYVYGAISDWSGMGIYDPGSNSWSKLTGRAQGKDVVGNAANQGTGVISDVAWDSKTGDMYIVGNWAPGIGNPEHEFPLDVPAVLRIDSEGNYHTMGYALKPEDPNKPVLGVYSIVLDESQQPSAIYIGGTFNYYGPTPTHNSKMAYNVAQWDHEQQDWRPIGKGVMRKLGDIDKSFYPEGYPGLPARTEDFAGFLAPVFGRVNDLLVDGQGNLYAAGSIAVLDDSLPISGRKEAYGLVKYDKGLDMWVNCSEAGGVSRDIRQMSWLDDTRILCSGSFIYDNQWNLLHNVAIFDTASGALEPLAGGLMRSGLEHVIGAQVVHTVKDGDYWFAGLFDFAGVNANSVLEGPVPSAYVARFSPGQNLDPNNGLVVQAPETVVAPNSFSSKSVAVTLTAELTDGEGTVLWFERRSDGQFTQKGKGLSYKANLRVKKGDGDFIYYVCVQRADGSMGGKIPVRIPVVQGE